MKYHMEANYKTSVVASGDFDTLAEAVSTAETLAAAMGLHASESLYYWSSEHRCVGVYASEYGNAVSR